MKILKILLALVVILIVAVIVAAPFMLKHAIMKAAPVVGQKVMGVPVSLGGTEISILKGKIHLDDINIGNPEGFKTDHAFKVKSINVEWEPKSVLSKLIVIKDITIDSPDIIFEQGLSGNNFGKIVDNLNKGKPPAEKKEAEEPKKEAAGDDESNTKVVINSFLIKGGMINLSLPGMGSAAAPVPLPEIHLTDIGKEKQGASVQEVANQVFGALFDSLKKVLASSLNLVGKGLENAGTVAVDGAQAVGDTAKDAAKTVGDTTKDAAKAAGDTAKDAAKTVGGTAEKAVGEIKGIFGGK